jgi:hypothetical protein
MNAMKHQRSSPQGMSLDPIRGTTTAILVLIVGASCSPQRTFPGAGDSGSGGSTSIASAGSSGTMTSANSATASSSGAGGHGGSTTTTSSSSSSSTSTSGGLVLVDGDLGTQGAQPSAVGALVLINQGFHYAGQACSGTQCVNGGLIP